jgi:hypothetical protein
VREEDADAVRWQHRLERPSSQRKTMHEAPDREVGIKVEGRLPLITDAKGRHATK